MQGLYGQKNYSYFLRTVSDVLSLRFAQRTGKLKHIPCAHMIYVQWIILMT